MDSSTTHKGSKKGLSFFESSIDTLAPVAATLEYHTFTRSWTIAAGQKESKDSKGNDESLKPQCRTAFNNNMHVVIRYCRDEKLKHMLS